jgi:hypothetical protein
MDAPRPYRECAWSQYIGWCEIYMKIIRHFDKESGHILIAWLCNITFASAVCAFLRCTAAHAFDYLGDALVEVMQSVKLRLAYFLEIHSRILSELAEVEHVTNGRSSFSPGGHCAIALTAS